MQKNNENGKVQMMRRQERPVRMMPQTPGPSGGGSVSEEEKEFTDIASNQNSM